MNTEKDTITPDVLGGVFEVTIKRANGEEETFKTYNRIVGEGKQFLLRMIGDEGAYNPAPFYVGLVSNNIGTVAGTESTIGAPASGDDIEEYGAAVWTLSARPEWVTDAVAGSGDGAYTVDNDTTKASYTVDTGQSATVYGAFLHSNTTIQNDTGTLFSIALFSGGSRALAADDEIQIKYTVTYATGA